MWKSDPYDKGTRKAQYTGGYGDFNPVHVKSEGSIILQIPCIVKQQKVKKVGESGILLQKPVALGRYLIRMFTKKGDVVLDNAFGSGSF